MPSKLTHDIAIKGFELARPTLVEMMRDKGFGSDYVALYVSGPDLNPVLFEIVPEGGFRKTEVKELAWHRLHRVRTENEPTRTIPDDPWLVKEELEGSDPGGVLYHKLYVGFAGLKGMANDTAAQVVLSLIKGLCRH